MTILLFINKLNFIYKTQKSKPLKIRESIFFFFFWAGRVDSTKKVNLWTNSKFSVFKKFNQTQPNLYGLSWILRIGWILGSYKYLYCTHTKKKMSTFYILALLQEGKYTNFWIGFDRNNKYLFSRLSRFFIIKI